MKSQFYTALQSLLDPIDSAKQQSWFVLLFSLCGVLFLSVAVAKKTARQQPQIQQQRRFLPVDSTTRGQSWHFRPHGIQQHQQTILSKQNLNPHHPNTLPDPAGDDIKHFKENEITNTNQPSQNHNNHNHNTKKNSKSNLDNNNNNNKILRDINTTPDSIMLSLTDTNGQRVLYQAPVSTRVGDIIYHHLSVNGFWSSPPSSRNNNNNNNATGTNSNHTLTTNNTNNTNNINNNNNNTTNSTTNNNTTTTTNNNNNTNANNEKKQPFSFFNSNTKRSNSTNTFFMSAMTKIEPQNIEHFMSTGPYCLIASVSPDSHKICFCQPISPHTTTQPQSSPLTQHRNVSTSNLFAQPSSASASGSSSSSSSSLPTTIPPPIGSFLPRSSSRANLIGSESNNGCGICMGQGFVLRSNGRRLPLNNTLGSCLPTRAEYSNQSFALPSTQYVLIDPTLPCYTDNTTQIGLDFNQNITGQKNSNHGKKNIKKDKDNNNNNNNNNTVITSQTSATSSLQLTLEDGRPSYSLNGLVNGLNTINDQHVYEVMIDEDFEWAFTKMQFCYLDARSSRETAIKRLHSESARNLLLSQQNAESNNVGSDNNTNNNKDNITSTTSTSSTTLLSSSSSSSSSSSHHSTTSNNESEINRVKHELSQIVQRIRDNGPLSSNTTTNGYNTDTLENQLNALLSSLSVNNATPSIPSSIPEHSPTSEPLLNSNDQTPTASSLTSSSSSPSSMMNDGKKNDDVKMTKKEKLLKQDLQRQVNDLRQEYSTLKDNNLVLQSKLSEQLNTNELLQKETRDLKSKTARFGTLQERSDKLTDVEAEKEQLLHQITVLIQKHDDTVKKLQDRVDKAEKMSRDDGVMIVNPPPTNNNNNNNNNNGKEKDKRDKKEAKLAQKGSDALATVGSQNNHHSPFSLPQGLNHKDSNNNNGGHDHSGNFNMNIYPTNTTQNNNNNNANNVNGGVEFAIPNPSQTSAHLTTTNGQLLPSPVSPSTATTATTATTAATTTQQQQHNVNNNASNKRNGHSRMMSYDSTLWPSTTPLDPQQQQQNKNQAIDENHLDSIDQKGNGKKSQGKDNNNKRETREKNHHGKSFHIDPNSTTPTLPPPTLISAIPATPTGQNGLSLHQIKPVVDGAQVTTGTTNTTTATTAATTTSLPPLPSSASSSTPSVTGSNATSTSTIHKKDRKRPDSTNAQNNDFHHHHNNNNNNPNNPNNSSTTSTTMALAAASSKPFFPNDIVKPITTTTDHSPTPYLLPSTSSILQHQSQYNRPPPPPPPSQQQQYYPYTGQYYDPHTLGEQSTLSSMSNYYPSTTTNPTASPPPPPHNVNNIAGLSTYYTAGLPGLTQQQLSVFTQLQSQQPQARQIQEALQRQYLSNQPLDPQLVQWLQSYQAHYAQIQQVVIEAQNKHREEQQYQYLLQQQQLQQQQHQSLFHHSPHQHPHHQQTQFQQPTPHSSPNIHQNNDYQQFHSITTPTISSTIPLTPLLSAPTNNLLLGQQYDDSNNHNDSLFGTPLVQGSITTINNKNDDNVDEVVVGGSNGNDDITRESITNIIHNDQVEIGSMLSTITATSTNQDNSIVNTMPATIFGPTHSDTSMKSINTIDNCSVKNQNDDDVSTPLVGTTITDQSFSATAQKQQSQHHHPSSLNPTTPLLMGTTENGELPAFGGGSYTPLTPLTSIAPVLPLGVVGNNPPDLHFPHNMVNIGLNTPTTTTLQLPSSQQHGQLDFNNKFDTASVGMSTLSNNAMSFNQHNSNNSHLNPNNNNNINNNNNNTLMDDILNVQNNINNGHGNNDNTDLLPFHHHPHHTLLPPPSAYPSPLHPTTNFTLPPLGTDTFQSFPPMYHVDSTGQQQPFGFWPK